MEHCSGGCVRSKGQIEDVKSWSNSLNAVLMSEEGRKEYIDFLQSYEFYRESLTVEFWGKCKDIEGKCNHLKIKSSAASHDSEALKAVVSEASSVVEELVNSSQVNLEPMLRRKLNDCVKKEDPDLMAKVFKDARSTAHDLVKELHSLFAEYLVEKYNLSNK